MYSVPKPYASSSVSGTQPAKATTKKAPKQVRDIYAESASDDDDRRKHGDEAPVDTYELNTMEFDSDNDEEVDEDCAFDDEDEARWGDFFAGREKSQSQRVRLLFFLLLIKCAW